MREGGSRGDRDTSIVKEISDRIGVARKKLPNFSKIRQIPFTRSEQEDSKGWIAIAVVYQRNVARRRS